MKETMSEPSKSLIITTENDHIITLTINRPERKNALTLAMYTEMSEVLNRCAERSEIKAVIITGAGGAFTSGNDLMDFMKVPPTNTDTPVFHFLKALLHFPKPIIAAVDGAAIGIGTTMLLHCDLIYATPKSKFQLPFIRLGLVPEAGASLLLPHMLGHRKAAELLMLGEMFMADTAQEVGIVNEVLEAEQLMEVVLKKAQTLASLPPAAMRQTKALLKRVHADQIEDCMQTEGEIFIKRLQSPETQEAFQAFFEKRKPDFSQFD